MEKYKPATQPLHTTNALLAFCLHMAGVPWEDNRKAVRVFYSKAIFDRMTNGSGEPIYKGWELEEAVKHAHKHGRRGHVEYVLKRTDRLRKLIEAFHAQEEQYEDATQREAHQVVNEIVTSDAAADIKMVRLACVFLKSRIAFMDLWKHQVPRMIVPNPGKVKRYKQTVETRHGVRECDVVESPGVKVVSMNASKETREALGL